MTEGHDFMTLQNQEHEARVFPHAILAHDSIPLIPRLHGPELGLGILRALSHDSSSPCSPKPASLYSLPSSVLVDHLSHATEGAICLPCRARG